MNPGDILYRCPECGHEIWQSKGVDRPTCCEWVMIAVGGIVDPEDIFGAII